MKRYFYFLFALCIGAVVMSCKPNNEAGEKEFIFMGGYDRPSGLSDSAINEQSAIILKAFRNAGFSDDKCELILMAPDSAAVSLILADKMKLVLSELEASPVKIKATIIVKGIEKKYLGAENDKEHPICLFYQKNIGLVQGDMWWEYLKDNYCEARWIHTLRSEEYSTYHINGIGTASYSVQIGDDTNKSVGGDYIYVAADFSGRCTAAHSAGGMDTGSPESDNHFVWEDSYANQYITDVICVYGGGEPQQITIDGRRYKKANRVADLNKNGGGEYVYLYTTTDPVKGYEGYYLNTGIGYHAHGKCCRMIYCKNHFWAKDHLNAPFVFEGHRFVERVVQAYWTNGTYAEEMNTNKGHGNNVTRCRMVLTYATKNGGY